MVQKTGTGAQRIVVEKREGRLELIKIKVDTLYDVCCDEVKDFDDYRNFYILKDGGNYYHWLKNPTDNDDIDKLKFLSGVIPITLHSKQNFEFEATFKVLLGDISKATIEVNRDDKDDPQKYQFKPQNVTSKSEGEEFSIKFKAKNKPYKNTIQYFEDFDLNFDITHEDNTYYFRKIIFRLYLTWKEPLWGEFEKFCSIMSASVIYDLKYPESKTLNIICRENNKKCLLESLLFISCQSNILAKASETEVVNQVFEVIRKKPLQVFRARNRTEPLGYWKCSSALKPSKFPARSEIFDASSRCERFMLRVGDGRCGEWSSFFVNLCQVQGIKTEKIKHLPFNFTKNTYDADNSFTSNAFLVKPWTINDPKRPIDNGGEAQGNNKPLNIFSDHVFVVYNGMFYDPSYGLKGKKNHLSWENILEEYTQSALQGILFSKRDSINGEEFYDNIHTEEYMNPQFSAYRIYPNKSSVPKLIYISSTKSMETYFEMPY